VKPIRLLALGPTHWLRTQAIYHALAETMTEETPDTIILTRPDQPYLCIGYHQELASVLDPVACDQRGLPIVRRRVGGGATYLDRDQLFYQCIFHRTRAPARANDVYATLLAAPVSVLHNLGLDAELRGVNEIELGGKRIAGIGGGWIGESVVVVGNLLFDFDYETMASVWRAPSDSFRHLAYEAMHDRITTLSASLPRSHTTPDEVQSVLVTEYARTLGRPLERGELTGAELSKVSELEARLVSDEWLGLHTNGAQPMTMLKISRGVFIHAAQNKINGFSMRASFRVRDGKIERAALESEPESTWADVEDKLRGMSVENWESAVTGLAL
jgi:lipoate-protein ligase A